MPVAEHTPNSRSKLDEPTRRAIAARVAQIGSITQTAKEFHVHINTVSRIWNSVKKVRNEAVDSLATWRTKLDTKSFEAVERSVDDTDEVHKAATTGLGWLKGVGVLAGENQSTVNVFVNQVLNLPADWRSEYLSNEPEQCTEEMYNGESETRTGEE